MFTSFKKILPEDRSFDARIQRIQEFQGYLEKPDSSKVILLTLEIPQSFFFSSVYYEISSISTQCIIRTIPRTV